MNKFSKRKMKDIVASVLAICLLCLILVNLSGVAHADGKRMNARKNLPEVIDPINNRNATKGTGNEIPYIDRSSKIGFVGSDNASDDMEPMNDGEYTYTQFKGDSEDQPSPK